MCVSFATKLSVDKLAEKIEENNVLEISECKKHI